ncbi:DUF4352 domain-containing protein [Modestobacter excelsi]|uniref:DUF4352 domain-containing protein n=1 Tax=Modestobacter excelsi TaxID=2213161 RepID=UPI001C20E1C5|nr:DUF4352 domain-containing protein [Modestobacter excelsi]
MTEPTDTESRPQRTDALPPVPPAGVAQPPIPAPEASRPAAGRGKKLTAALAVGLVVGGGIGAGASAALSDPTGSDEYQALAVQLETARGENADDQQQAAAPSTSAAAASSSGAADGPQLAPVGQTVSNGGVTLTVTGAFVADTIELNETSYAPGSGYEEYTPTPPDAGGKYVVVETHVVNNAQVSMDLTCGFPIDTAVVDAQERYFDTIDSLYKLRDNPECNDQLQPGFEADMTYVYMVPATAQITAFGFADATDLANSSTKYTGVQLTL